MKKKTNRTELNKGRFIYIMFITNVLFLLVPLVFLWEAWASGSKGTVILMIVFISVQFSFDVFAIVTAVFFWEKIWEPKKARNKSSKK